MAATHDLEQARGWDRVLCLNRRVIAFGDPGDVLSAEVLAQTYGGDIVLLGDDARPAILPPHHH
jgi:manganese/iron transport system ATP-binding protein/manganese/zinc/iron transport system ATP- binding protein